MRNYYEDQLDDRVSEPLLEPIHQDDKFHINFRTWLNSIHYSRWQSFSGVCFYVSVVGTTYAFGVYSDLLKNNLGFSQNGIDVIASVGNTGLYLSLLGGILLDRFGLHMVVYLGGFLIFAGFFYIWLAIEGYVPADIFSVSVFFLLSQFGVCCHISSAVTCAVRLFPKEVRGSAVGLAKGYFGLSSAVLSDFSGGYFSNSKEYFILFIAISIPLIGCVGVSLANFLPQHAISLEFDEKRGISTSLLPFFMHWSILFLVLSIVGYVQYAYDYTGKSSLIAPSFLAITILSILIIPSFYGERIIKDDIWYKSSTSNNSAISGEKYEKKKLNQRNEISEENSSTACLGINSSEYDHLESCDNEKLDLRGMQTGKRGCARTDAGTDSGLYFGKEEDNWMRSRTVSTDDEIDINIRYKELQKNDKIDFNNEVKNKLDKTAALVSEKTKNRPNQIESQTAHVKGRKYGYGAVTPLKVKDEYENKKKGKVKLDEIGYKSFADGIPKRDDDTGNIINHEDRCSVEYYDEDKDRNQIENQSIEMNECFFGASIPLSVSVRTWRFWSLYVSFLTICGTGLMVIDNINVISQALEKQPNDYFVTLLSLANGAGRVTAGYTSDLISKYFSKLQFLSFIAILMGISNILFAIGSPEYLYLSLLFVGYLFGCTVSLLAVIVADTFGPKYISTNFGAVDSAPIFGSYIFVTGIVTLFYETNTVNELGEKSCIGASCFRKPFMINSVCCFSVAFILYRMHLTTPMGKFDAHSISTRVKH